MQRVKSSNIHAVDYLPVESEMHVQFNCGKCSGDGCPSCHDRGHTGQTYVYSDVPVEVYAKVRDAESVGRQFNESVKNWKHPETKEGYRFSKRPA